MARLLGSATSSAGSYAEERNGLKRENHSVLEKGLKLFSRQQSSMRVRDNKAKQTCDTKGNVVKWASQYSADFQNFQQTGVVYEMY